MLTTYDYVSSKSSKLVTTSYSTSFSMATSLLDSTIRKHVYSIYGFTRLADEIVDTFNDYEQEELLNKFESDLLHAIKNKISLNPVLHSFQRTYHEFGFDAELVDAFLKSMRYDLYNSGCSSEKERKQYVWGSAEVIGLMCLKVFVKGDHHLYEELKTTAISLGSAFQNVNFLRDLSEDQQKRNRNYFPKIYHNGFTEGTKSEIIQSIEKDFKHSHKGIMRLPKKAKFGVYIAYRYYLRLLKKLKKASTNQIKEDRIRVTNAEKFYIIVQSFVKLNFQ